MGGACGPFRPLREDSPYPHIRGVHCFWGSGTVRIGAEVNAALRRQKVSSACGDHLKLTLEEVRA